MSATQGEGNYGVTGSLEKLGTALRVMCKCCREGSEADATPRSALPDETLVACYVCSRNTLLPHGELDKGSREGIDRLIRDLELNDDTDLGRRLREAAMVPVLSWQAQCQGERVEHPVGNHPVAPVTVEWPSPRSVRSPAELAAAYDAPEVQGAIAAREEAEWGEVYGNPAEHYIPVSGPPADVSGLVTIMGDSFRWGLDLEREGDVVRAIVHQDGDAGVLDRQVARFEIPVAVLAALVHNDAAPSD